MTAKVSIILPVYNCAGFLRACLDSLVEQTHRDLEVVVIDDGSTDGSGEIAEGYAALDSRIRVLHQQNQGPAAARNRGLLETSAEFILMIDGDDWLESRYVERMLEPVQEYDLVVCGYNRVRGDAEQRLLPREGVLQRDELYEHTLCTNWIGAGCWNKVFRRSLLEKAALGFETGMPWGDDLLFLIQYYRYCTSVYYVREALYNYRLNPNSLMKSAYTARMFKPEQARILDALRLAAGWIDPAEQGEVRAFAYRKVRSGLRLLFHLAVCSQPDRRLFVEIRELIRSGYWVYVKSRHSRALEKLAATMVAAWPGAAYGAGKLLVRFIPGKVGAYLD